MRNPEESLCTPSNQYSWRNFHFPERMRGWRWEEIAQGDDENQSQWACGEEGGHTEGWTPD